MFFLYKRETQLTFLSSLAQLQWELSKKDMLFKKTDIKLGKVIGQGEDNYVPLLKSSVS